MIRLYLVRHGQASFDADDYDQLSPLGLQQSESFGQWWCGRREQVDGVWHGGLRRQAQTAQAWRTAAAAARSGDPLPEAQVAAGLREFDHRAVFFAARPDLRDAQALQAWKAAPGDYQQRFADTYAAAQARWLGHQHAQDYPESWAQVRERVLAALATIAQQLHPRAQQQGAAVALVFTSAGPISAVLQAVRGVADLQVPDLQAGLHNAGVTVLQLDALAPASTWRIEAVNDTAHLGQSGVAVSHR